MSPIKLSGRLLSRLEFAFVRYVYWHFNKPVYVILLGGPGAGKGTLATQLAPKLGLAHISTGNLFRREISRHSALGKKIEPILKSGGLVPDEITIAVVARELARFANRRGAVLDGFPRTVNQALLLERLLDSWSQEVCFVFFLDVETGDLIVRLAGRRTCSNKACGLTYHMDFNPPKKNGVCDKCGSALYQREDDREDVVLARIENFNGTNEPMLRFYKQRGRLFTIKSSNRDGKDSVLTRVLAVMFRNWQA